MKTKQTKVNSAFLILTLLFLASALFIFRYLHDRELQYPYSLTNFVDTGDYKIDPYTILDDLEQGEKNVFVPVDNDTVENNNTYTSTSVPWQQSDHLKIADALHQFVWNETLDDWNIFGMIFTRDCQEDVAGFDYADITFYKYNKKQGGYKVHEIVIYPSGVSWGGADNWSRPLFGWTSIDLQRLKVTADNALQIAEDNGGNKFRAKTNNRCDIHLVNKPNPDSGNDWAVYYHANGDSDRFEIQIDPYTGWH